MLDLVLPRECGGCGAPGVSWCGSCAGDLAVRDDQPHVVIPRIDPGVPVFALGRYAGPRRRAIVELKEHGRSDLAAVFAPALRQALTHLATWGIVDGAVALVPAPTRFLAARRRGGDPVTRIARATGRKVIPALRTRPFTRDSVGLSVTDRERNIAGRIRLTAPPGRVVLLVDDVITTGATAAESVRVLQTAGAEVPAVLTLAYA
ncbi:MULTISPECIES: ComF family protein [Mycobacteriaceae]|uniref:ComF family protein n=1 Tax=Mycobacteriaceae TaxID=1762 RepID=UPI0007FE0568|nr:MULTISPECIES: ComF family protein [Mycobacteriaceae]MCK0174617.1 ComF family protein [Mycolicibacterium sp. F2034L]OBB60908.1 phosphoribosyltransferase [Mycobacterium sp. 852013-51886_SCH5428379]